MEFSIGSTHLLKVRRPEIHNIALRTWRSMRRDRIFGHAAELGFYFLFALFPTLFSASSILGLAARSAPQIFDRLLGYLALLIPTSALSAVLQTFNETAAAATSGKITFGLIASIWSASVGVSAIQDTLNDVNKFEDSRSYFRARLDAIGLTVLLTVMVILCLASLFGGDFIATSAHRLIRNAAVASAVTFVGRIIAWLLATALLSLLFSVVYFGAPDSRHRHWQWITPGAAIGIGGWLIASFALRVYIHFFNDYSITYGSLGAVIILLTWFYFTGLMLLVGAEINSQIAAAHSEGHERQPQATQPEAEARDTDFRCDNRCI